MARTLSLLQLFSRLARDNAGNTLVIIAGALLPLLALVGGGVDASRGYMAQARLQQACDAGVLAARKQLGSSTPNSMPGTVRDRGKRFFDVNFPDKIYGTTGRKFDMTMETDFSISGVADVVVPTTVMNIFGYKAMPLKVECSARLNFNNLDVMMVIDTTGSMRHTNAGDPMNRIDSVRAVIKDFHNQLETSKQPGTRTRYGFVPYASNVNVGLLLDPDWMVDSHSYSLRTAGKASDGSTEEKKSFRYDYVSGDRTFSNYTSTDCPAHTAQQQVVSTTTNQDGSITERRKLTGSWYHCSVADGGGYVINQVTNNDYIEDFTTTITTRDKYNWFYADETLDVSKFKQGNKVSIGTITKKISGNASNPQDSEGWFHGCVKERKTYVISDYANVDLTKARDLDIDFVPNSDDTRWKPVIDAFGFVRGVDPLLGGTPTNDPVEGDTFYNDAWYGFTWNGAYMHNSQCPSPSQKLAEMTAGEVATYVDGLILGGKTYHDLGMIWGGRLLSKDGLFASENADVNGRTTSRHLIFLTDGQTEPLDIVNGAYGIEGMKSERWSPSSPLTLAQTVEERFKFACSEVKKRNVTIWVIAFGTSLNPAMTECAGPGRYYEAANSSELSTAFNSILKNMGDLRIAK